MSNQSLDMAQLNAVVKKLGNSVTIQESKLDKVNKELQALQKTIKELRALIVSTRRELKEQTNVQERDSV